jgi:ribosomal protein S18 acetylase RimI-like enzyme
MAIKITKMTIKDYDEVFALWQNSEGVCLHDDSDSKKSIQKYLKRNPDLSFIVRDKNLLVRAILCGHDGRRGYLHHLAVAKSHRKKGLGKILVQKSLSKLLSVGIPRCHIFVLDENINAQKFWKKTGWLELKNLKIISKKLIRNKCE